MDKSLIEKIMKSDKLLANVLNEHLEKGDLKQFFICVVLIGEAKCGGKSNLAGSAGLSRQTIYNSMKQEKVTLKTCNALLNVIGFRFQVRVK